MSSAATPTEQKLQAIIAKKLQVALEQVPLDQSLTEDLGLDSLDMMAVILEIEKVFAPISVLDKSAAELKTLSEVAAYIDRERSRT
jgi:acyl carrier protein